MNLQEEAESSRSLSLGGLLAIALSIGGWAAYVKFRRLLPPSLTLLYIFWLVEGALVLGGLYFLIQSLTGKTERSRTANRYRVTVPREGLTYLLIMIALFIGSLLGHSNMLMLVFAMMAGPFIVNGWVSFSMLQHLVISRRLPQRAMAGETFSVEINLENQRTFLSSWMMLAKDTITRLRSTEHTGSLTRKEAKKGTEQYRATVLFACVPPKQSQEAHYQLSLPERGIYRFGPIEISSRFPLGLTDRGFTFPAINEIKIYPRIGQLSSHWKKQLTGAMELISQPKSRHGIFNDEFHRLREYRYGDNPRAIHWRSSARRGELILREYHQNREHDLAVLADFWSPSQPTTESHQRIEWACSFLATLCWEHVRDCRESELFVACSGQQHWKCNLPANQWGCEELFDRLAVIQGGAAKESVQMLNELLQEIQSTTRLIVISTRNADDPLMTQLQHHRAQLVHVIDPRHMPMLVLEDSWKHVPGSWTQRELDSIFGLNMLYWSGTETDFMRSSWSIR